MNKTLFLIPLWGLFCEIQVSFPLKLRRGKNYTIHYSRHSICIEHFSYCGSCQNIPRSATSAPCHCVLLVTPWPVFPMSTTLQHAKHPIPCILFPFAARLRFTFLPLPGRHLILLKIRKSVWKLQVFVRRDTLNDSKVDSLHGVFCEITFLWRFSEWFLDTYFGGYQFVLLDYRAFTQIPVLLGSIE